MKIRHFRIIFLLLLFISLGTAHNAQAASVIKTAKANTKELGKQVTKGRLYKKGSKIRFKFRNGKKAKDIWLYYKKNVYYFKKSGNARRNRFFKYEGDWYYADKDGHVLYKKWLYKDKKYYYLKKTGIRAENETLKIGGRTYVFKKDGTLDKKKSDGLASDRYLFVGDSRTVGMEICVGGEKAAYIGAVSMGYSWLVSTAGPQVRKHLNSTPDINVIFCFGVNDPGNIAQYIAWYNALLKAYPKANIFFMAVNPCGAGRASLNNEIAAFNAQLKKAFGNRYIDTWTYLTKYGFAAVDGVHYTAPTYLSIYNYTLKCIREYIPVA